MSDVSGEYLMDTPDDAPSYADAYESEVIKLYTEADIAAAAHRADDEPVVIVVVGQPEPQGSKTRTRYGMREDNENLRPWRDAVTWNAIHQVKLDQPLSGPLRLSAAFSFRRPAGHYLPVNSRRSERELRDNAPWYPIGKPDLSKLVRAVEDSLTDAGIWGDDAQVVDYCGTRKLWCGEHPSALDQPGVLIYIRQVTG